MPVIQFIESVPAVSGTNVPASGVFRFTPTRSFNNGGEEVLPKPFEVTLDTTGRASATLAQTGPGWCWLVEQFITGTTPKGTYVTVGASDAAWPSLTRVDPATLNPVTSSAAWAASLPTLTVDGSNGTWTLTTNA